MTNNVAMKSNIDESHFIDALIAQDEAAFRQLMRDYYSPLLMLAKAIVGDSIAEEVVQQAWINAMRALPKFEKRSTLKTWLSRIVMNEARTRLRREKRYSSLEAMGFDEPDAFFDQFDSRGHWSSAPISWHGDTPDKLLEKEQLNTCIQATIKKLPPMQQAAFMLREIQGQSYEQICNTLEVSESNIRVLLHRAKNKLLKAVEVFQETGQCL
jgi:RNA polymerase sigma-70 factor (ECF subfamily)